MLPRLRISLHHGPIREGAPAPSPCGWTRPPRSRPGSHKLPVGGIANLSAMGPTRLAASRASFRQLACYALSISPSDRMVTRSGIGRA
jgi:hypothetical protein